jgi:hypothetical protein
MKPIVLGACVAVLGLCGCTLPSMAPEVPVTGDSTAPGARYALDISNHRGNIAVLVEEGLERPVVTAHPWGGGRAPASVKWVAAQVDRGEVHSVLRVLSVPPEGEGDVAVDLSIRVPGCAGVRVRNGGGEVRVVGARGAVDVQNGGVDTIGGPVSVSFAERLDAPVLVKTSKGHVSVEAGSGSKADLTLRCTGQASVIVPAEAMSDVRTAKGEWRGRLNGGGFEVVLVSDDGDAVLRMR